MLVGPPIQDGWHGPSIGLGWSSTPTGWRTCLYFLKSRMDGMVLQWGLDGLVPQPVGKHVPSIGYGWELRLALLSLANLANDP